MMVYMVTLQKAEKTDTQYYIDEIKLFSNFDAAKAYAKYGLKKILEIFNIPEDKVRISEEDYPEKEELAIHANFQHEDREWNSWTIVQKKEIE